MDGWMDGWMDIVVECTRPNSPTNPNLLYSYERYSYSHPNVLQRNPNISLVVQVPL